MGNPFRPAVVQYLHGLDFEGIAGVISLLQVFRGIAAMLVVYHHVNQEVIELYGQNTLRSLFDFGDAGVQFFFVLSGFIIYYVHRRDIGRRDVVGTFFKKRVIRVYPVYILVTLILTPFWAFIPDYGAAYHKHLSSFIYSLLLIPQTHVPNLGVGWTLTHEVLFYGLFAALIFSRVIGRAVLGFWFFVIAVSNLVASHELAFPLSHLLSINNLLFGMGMLGALLVLKSSRQRDAGWVMVVMGAAAFLIVAVTRNLLYGEGVIDFHADRLFILCLGLASFLIVLQSGSARVEAVMSRWKLMNVIGTASFSIYLIHQPAVSLLRKLLVFAGWQYSISPGLVFLLGCLFAIAAGIAMYYSVEKPMLNVLTRRYIRKPVSAQSEPIRPENYPLVNKRDAA